MTPFFTESYSNRFSLLSVWECIFRFSTITTISLVTKLSRVSISSIYDKCRRVLFYDFFRLDKYNLKRVYDIEVFMYFFETFYIAFIMVKSREVIVSENFV